MTFPEVPKKFLDYLLVLVMFSAFAGITAFINWLGVKTPVPAPPITIEAIPVVVTQGADGSITVQKYSPSK